MDLDSAEEEAVPLYKSFHHGTCTALYRCRSHAIMPHVLHCTTIYIMPMPHALHCTAMHIMPSCHMYCNVPPYKSCHHVL